MSNVRIVSKTAIDEDYLHFLMSKFQDLDFIKNVQKPEGLAAYCARVSSPNPANPAYAKLLKYCADHGHWSVFEMADATFEIETSRAIAPQILRHRSFCFQEFSQRYAKAEMGYEIYSARSQDQKNRQNSIDDMSEKTKEWFKNAQIKINDEAKKLYDQALEKGIAKEQARFLLTGATKTKLFMKGNLRNWIHYVELRSGNGTQKEHAEIADAIKKILIKKFPIIAESRGWNES